jgi:hypothetical protein
VSPDIVVGTLRACVGRELHILVACGSAGTTLRIRPPDVITAVHADGDAVRVTTSDGGAAFSAAIIGVIAWGTEGDGDGESPGNML